MNSTPVNNTTANTTFTAIGAAIGNVADTITGNFKQAKNWDDNREGVMGEHWLVLAAGVGLVIACNRNQSTLIRVAGSALGAALVVRAASGRDGVAKLLPYVPGVRDLVS